MTSQRGDWAGKQTTVKWWYRSTLITWEFYLEPKLLLPSLQSVLSALECWLNVYLKLTQDKKSETETYLGFDSHLCVYKYIHTHTPTHSDETQKNNLLAEWYSALNLTIEDACSSTGFELQSSNWYPSSSLAPLQCSTLSSRLTSLYVDLVSCF